jgi:hypothetical protein
MDGTGKQCTKCREIKDISLFGTYTSKQSRVRPDRIGKTITSPVCKSCQALKSAEYRSRGGYKERVRNNYLWDTHKLTTEEYNLLLAYQENVCQICKSSEKNGTYHVDHCHRTGDIRGILCGSCNRGIGYLQDNLQIARSSVEYLEESQA